MHTIQLHLNIKAINVWKEEVKGLSFASDEEFDDEDFLLEDRHEDNIVAVQEEAGLRMCVAHLT